MWRGFNPQHCLEILALVAPPGMTTSRLMISKSDGSLCRNIEVEYGLWTETTVLDSIVFQGKFWLTSSNATPISINSTDCWRSLRGSWCNRGMWNTQLAMEDCVSSRFESLRDGLESFRLSDDDLESMTKRPFWSFLIRRMFGASAWRSTIYYCTNSQCARIDVQTWGAVTNNHAMGVAWW